MQALLLKKLNMEARTRVRAVRGFMKDNRSIPENEHAVHTFVKAYLT